MLLNNKKLKFLVVGCLLLGAQIVFAQEPFGDSSDSSSWTIPAGGAVETSTSTSAGGSINTSTTTSSGGTIQSGGGVRSGGGVSSGGSTQSGGRIGAGGVTNHTGGTIEAGDSINTKVCKQYAVKTITVKSPISTEASPIWIQKTVEDTSKCLVWDYNPTIEAGGMAGSKVCGVYAETNTWSQDPVTKKWTQKTVVDKNTCLAWNYELEIVAGGLLDTKNCVQYWQRTVFDEKPPGSGNFVPRTFEDKSYCMIWDYNPNIIAGGNINVEVSTKSNFFFPSIPTTVPKDLKGFIALFIDLIKIIIPIIGSLSLFVFFWGLAKFVRHAGSEKEEGEGKDLMIWGVIALFVMVSVYGIVNLMYASLFGGGAISLPLLPQ